MKFLTSFRFRFHPGFSKIASAFIFFISASVSVPLPLQGDFQKSLPLPRPLPLKKCRLRFLNPASSIAKIILNIEKKKDAMQKSLKKKQIGILISEAYDTSVLKSKEWSLGSLTSATAFTTTTTATITTIAEVAPTTAKTKLMTGRFVRKPTYMEWRL